MEDQNRPVNALPSQKPSSSTSRAVQQSPLNAPIEKPERDGKFGENNDDDSGDDSEGEFDEDDEIGDDDEAVVHEVQQAAAPQVISRARLVTLPQRVPPKLPDRNPFRARISTIQASDSGHQDSGHGTQAQSDRGAFVTSSSEREASLHSNKSESSRESHIDGVTSSASSPDKALSFKSVKSAPSPDLSPTLETHIPGGFPILPQPKSPTHSVLNSPGLAKVSRISLSSIRHELGSDEQD